MKGKSASFWKDHNRTFGLVMACGLGGLALVRFAWIGAITWWLIGPAVLFLTIGLLAPAWLDQVRTVWMKLAAVLGYVNSRILLTVLFIGLILPTALVLRVLGKQPIQLKFRDGAVSYWRRRKPEEFAAGRMERQF